MLGRIVKGWTTRGWLVTRARPVVGIHGSQGTPSSPPFKIIGVKCLFVLHFLSSLGKFRCVRHSSSCSRDPHKLRVLWCAGEWSQKSRYFTRNTHNLRDVSPRINL